MKISFVAAKRLSINLNASPYFWGALIIICLRDFETHETNKDG